MKRPYNVPVGGKYGAPMGRADEGASNDDPIRLSIARVPMVDYAYDAGGAYWGAPDYRAGVYPLWCAWSADRSVIRYFRAAGRLEAVAKVRDEFSGAKL